MVLPVLQRLAWRQMPAGSFPHDRYTMEAGQVSREEAVICPKCGKPAWTPYVMQVAKKYGQVYAYRVYRHPDGRRRTPRKRTVKVTDSD